MKAVPPRGPRSATSSCEPHACAVLARAGLAAARRLGQRPVACCWSCRLPWAAARVSQQQFVQVLVSVGCPAGLVVVGVSGMEVRVRLKPKLVSRFSGRLCLVGWRIMPPTASLRLWRRTVAMPPWCDALLLGVRARCPKPCFAIDPARLSGSTNRWLRSVGFTKAFCSRICSGSHQSKRRLPPLWQPLLEQVPADSVHHGIGRRARGESN